VSSSPSPATAAPTPGEGPAAWWGREVLSVSAGLEQRSWATQRNAWAGRLRGVPGLHVAEARCKTSPFRNAEFSGYFPSGWGLVSDSGTIACLELFW
jgi:hypothetical protein